MRFIEKALYNTLTASTALTALVGGTASFRIYNSILPQGVTLPVLVFQKMGGGHIADNPKVNVEAVYMVKAIANDLQAAENIDFMASNALDRQSIGVNTDGYSDYACFRSMGLHFIEDQGGGKIAFHIGALYAVKAAQNQ